MSYEALKVLINNLLEVKKREQWNTLTPMQQAFEKAVNR